YYSSVQGRFSSVDPENAGADESNPQTWNGYSYALNNPVLLTDPDGQKVRVCGAEGACTDNDTDLSDADFNKFFRNAKDITLKDGQVFQNGNLIGSFERQSFDDLSDFANGVIFGNGDTAGLVDRAPAAGNASLTLLGGSVLVGAGVGAGIYAAPAVIAAIVERQIAGRITSEVANATVNRRIYTQLEKQLASAGAKSIYKALRKAEQALEQHVRKSGDAYFKSSIEGTIKNVANQIKTIQRLIKDKGL
ncbi:MAG: hypothetical protein ACRD4L_15130, partial [Pyrinomonadaceae bacterium]